MSTPLPARPTGADAPRRRSSALLAATAVLAFGALGAALVSQHAFGMDPCAWCVLQRAIFVAVGLAAVLGLLFRSPPMRSLMSGLGLLLALAGIAAALWQHFVAAASGSCNLTLADRIVTALGLDSALPDVFAARASCADAAIDLLGIPYDFWSLAAFVILALLLVRVITLQGRVARLARR